ncbi:MAG: redoxin domain-containing protein [Saprospiraceae bacterium]
MSCKTNSDSTGSTSTRPMGKVDIKLKVSGEAAGIVQLAGIYADQNFLADTTHIDQAGNIHFKKDSLFKSGMYFVVLPDQQNFQMLLDADQEFEMTTNAADLINSMQVKGSEDNDMLYQSLKLQLGQEKQTQPLFQKIQGLPENDPEVAAYKKMADEFRLARKAQLDEFEKKAPHSFFISFKKAGQNPDVKDIKLADGQPDLNAEAYFFRKEYWDNTDLSDVRLMYTPVMSNKIKQYFTDITAQHQDSLVKQIDEVLPKTLSNPELFKYMSNWLLFKYEPGKTTLMDGEAVFSHVVNKYFTADKATWLKPGDLRAIQQRADEMKGSLLNHKGLDVIAKDPNGNTKSIYEIKTPYIVVYLFHTDCEHCQEMTPKLSKMYPQLKSRGVTIYTIAVNTTDAEWKKFIPKYDMTEFINVFDPTNVSVYGKYFVDNTPEIYILNKERIIIGKNLKPDQINTIIDLDQKK